MNAKDLKQRGAVKVKKGAQTIEIYSDGTRIHIRRIRPMPQYITGMEPDETLTDAMELMGIH